MRCASKGLFRPVLFVLLAALLAGCNTLPRQEFNAKANHELKQIGIIMAVNDDEYPVVLLHHPGASFGLIGGLMAAADMSSKSGQFTTEVDLQGEKLMHELQQALQALEDEGRYQVSFIKMENLDQTELLDDYSKLTAEVDAYLDVRLASVGYLAQYPNTPYVPEVMAKAKLVDARTHQVLYEATLAYGENWRQVEGLIQLPNDQEYNFHDFTDLTNRVDHAREGLLVATRSLGQRINLDLRQ